MSRHLIAVATAFIVAALIGLPGGADAKGKKIVFTKPIKITVSTSCKPHQRCDGTIGQGPLR
jgi:hypothetical protein